MKVLAVALATLLLVVICSPAEAHLDDSNTIPTSCCFTLVRNPIPRRIVTSAYITSSMCSLPAVVLVTKKGRQLCADPQASWVKEHLKYLEMQEY
ncbi:C-C motif chemokine 5-like [Numenius arquata]|uniref:C-C motif chemokine 5-like n=1 Tax=Numenius arquata TaxID=31919 RepID=UPI003D30B610